MPLIYDDTVNCSECGNNTFRAEEHLQFHKNVTPRDFDRSNELPAINRIIVYVCTKCGHELDK